MRDRVTLAWAIIFMLFLLAVAFTYKAPAQTLGTVVTGGTSWDNTPYEVSATVPSGGSLLVVITGQGGHDSVYWNGTEKMTLVTHTSGSLNNKSYKLASPTSGTHNVKIYRDTYTFEHYSIIPIDGGGSDVVSETQSVAGSWVAGGSIDFTNTDGQLIVIQAISENNNNAPYWAPYGTWYMQDSTNYPGGYMSIQTADSANQHVEWWVGDTPTTNAIALQGLVLDAPDALEDTVAPSIVGPTWRPRSTQNATTVNYLTFSVTDGPAEFAGVESVYVWRDGVLKFQIYTANSPADTTLDSLNMGGWSGIDTIDIRAVDDSNNVATKSWIRRSGIPTLTSVTGYLPTWAWGSTQGITATGGQGMTQATVPWEVLTHVVHLGINALDTVGFWEDSLAADNWREGPRYPYVQFTAPKATYHNGWFVYDSVTAWQSDSIGPNNWDDRLHRVYGWPVDSADVLYDWWRNTYDGGDWDGNLPRMLDSMKIYGRPPNKADSTRFLLSIGGIYGYGQGCYNFMYATGDSVWQHDYFVDLVGFANRNGYDGIEIDWEPPSSMANMSKMIRMLKPSSAAIRF